MIMEDNYFNLLELPEDATKEEIRDAYYALAQKYHPDRNASSDATERFQLIQEAFEVLSDEKKNSRYRERISTGSKKSPILFKKIFSAKRIALVDEKQILYALSEIDCKQFEDSNLSTELNLCLVIDYSTSMAGRLDFIKTSISRLIDKLKDSDIISIIGFSDFAEAIIPPMEVRDFKRYQNRFAIKKAHGATELFKGLDLGVRTLSKDHAVTRVKRLLLLTDGHTYGDEEPCYKLAKQALEQRISIYALGFGDKWNDEFLDKVASNSGGNASFVATQDDLDRLLNEKAFTAENLYAQQIKLAFDSLTGTRLNYIFRLIPDASPLSVQNPLQLGNLNYGQRMLLLFEFIIDPVKKYIETMNILKGKLLLNVPSKEVKCERYFIDWTRPVSKSFDKGFPPESIVHAISRLTLYRMQEKARKDIEQKNSAEASRKLKYLAAQLHAQGEHDFAKTVMYEAQQVERTGRFSQESDKRIKYGTRSLLLPSGLESE